MLHEYPFCPSKEQHSHGIIEGDYFIQARTEGARSKQDPKEKYLADAQTLEDALLEEQDPSLVRKVFVLFGAELSRRR